MGSVRSRLASRARRISSRAARSATASSQVYDIANNQLAGAASLGQVGLDWQLGGIAPDPFTHSANIFPQ